MVFMFSLILIPCTGVNEMCCSFLSQQFWISKFGQKTQWISCWNFLSLIGWAKTRNIFWKSTSLNFVNMTVIVTLTSNQWRSCVAIVKILTQANLCWHWHNSTQRKHDSVQCSYLNLKFVMSALARFQSETRFNLLFSTEKKWIQNILTRVNKFSAYTIPRQ